MAINHGLIAGPAHGRRSLGESQAKDLSQPMQTTREDAVRNVGLGLKIMTCLLNVHLSLEGEC